MRDKWLLDNEEPDKLGDRKKDFEEKIRERELRIIEKESEKQVGEYDKAREMCDETYSEVIGYFPTD